jgi:hypothetical protein
METAEPVVIMSRRDTVSQSKVVDTRLRVDRKTSTKAGNQKIAKISTRRPRISDSVEENPEKIGSDAGGRGLRSSLSGNLWCEPVSKDFVRLAKARRAQRTQRSLPVKQT